MTTRTRKDADSTRTAGESEVGVHMGKILMMVAAKYESLPRTLLEGVQNAIDADATIICIGVHTGHRLAVVADNGRGASKKQFDESIAQVAESRKAKDRLGQFGIGVVSPINKCEVYEFISRAEGQSRPTQWTFCQADIVSQGSVKIPYKTLERMPKLEPSLRPGFKLLEGKCRTMMVMHGITSDRAISSVDPDELDELIRGRFGPMMLARGISCRLVIAEPGREVLVRDIKPRNFTGEPLPLEVIDDPVAGRVEIQLYRANRIHGKRGGKVGVSELEPEYPIGWSEFRTQAWGLGWSGDSPVFDVFASGYFEGVIRCENIKLSPERNKFERGDALIHLYVVLDDWFNRVGRKYYEEEQEQARDERYRRLSLEVMEDIHAFLLEEPGLVQTLRDTIEMGRVGQNHGTEGKDLNGADEQPSTRTGQGGAGTPRTPRDKPTGGGRGSSPTRDGDVPTGLIGQGSRPRVQVHEDSIGLWLEITDFEFSSRLWEFDRRTGVLSFNSRNAVWSELDGLSAKRRTVKHDRQIKHLQKWVVLQVLHLLREPADLFEERRKFVDAQLRHYVSMFIQA